MLRISHMKTRNVKTWKVKMQEIKMFYTRYVSTVWELTS
jgi:hypothetical protein